MILLYSYLNISLVERDLFIIINLFQYTIGLSLYTQEDKDRCNNYFNRTYT
jgi:hypothetical protein